jgi:hypothetical protein
MQGAPIDTHVLIIPGMGNSGPQHWQSRWEATHPSFRRVMQRDWERPLYREWLEALDATVADTGPDTILVAHSLGCLLVTHWAAQTRQRIRAALLVAVPDPLGPNFPRAATGFAPVPLTPLPFPSLVVASTDDPYGDPAHAAHCAQVWGSRFINVGAHGHLNAESNLGDWPQGFALFQSLLDD